MWKIVILLLSAGLTALADESGLKTTLLPGNILWIRAERLPPDLPERMSVILASNKVDGVVIDLRFASGNAEPHLPPLEGPIAALVNKETSRSALNWVSCLQTNHRGIIIASTNMPTGITPHITVDIDSDAERKFQVNPFAEPERKPPARDGIENLLPFIDHTSEADLVRQRVSGTDPRLTPDSARHPAPQPVIHDPALARASDFIKAVVRLHPGLKNWH